MDDAVLVSQRRIERLLGALVALTAVLCAALMLGGALAWREYGHARRAADAVVGGRGVPALVEEMAARQRRAAERLSAMGADARKQIASFEKRATEIRAKGGGPIDSAAKALDIATLMMDQSIFALKQSAAMQDAIVMAGPLGGDGDEEAGAEDVDDPSDGRRAPGNRARRPPPPGQPERGAR